jgi:2-hydroxy-6-oxonona-2,4-dienedioate hydrolase
MSLPAPRPRIAVHVEGSGPRVALLHGGMGSRTHWARNLPSLTPHYEVHAIDLPGCGDSDGVPADIADPDYVGIVADELARIAGPDPLRLVGFSFGAVIASMCAARLGPTIGRLVILGPGGFGPASGRRLDLRKIPPGATDPSIERDVLRHNLRVMMLAHDASADDEAIALQRENARRTRFDSRRFSLGAYLLPALAQVRCPIHLVYGELDNLAWPSVAARVDAVRTALPQVQVDIVPGGGHWVQFERAAELNRILLERLRG